MAEPQIDMSWRSTDYRQKIIAQIEEAIRSGNAPPSKTGAELEEQVSQKTNTREEYLFLVAKIICHVKGVNIGNMQSLNGNTVGMNLNQAGVNASHDPISALKAIINMIIQQVPGQTMNAPMIGMGSRPPFLGNFLQIPRRPIMEGPMRNEMFMVQPRSGIAGQGAMVGQVPNQIMATPNNQNNTMGMNAQHFHHIMQRQPSPGQLGMLGPSMSFNNTMSVIPGSIQSPAGRGLMPPSGSVGSVNMTMSPASLIPSHSPGLHVAPSPARMLASVLSPGGAVNTPGNPGSVGGTTVGANLRLSAAEDLEYMEKWKQLQKYIDPLKRMINKIDKDEDRKVELVKMKNLLDILSDSTKRLPISTLNKCESVLEKQLGFTKEKTSSVQTWTAGSNAAGGNGVALQIGQSLYDAIATNVKSPLLNNTLQRTFEPAVRALHGCPRRMNTPPAKRLRLEEMEDGFDVPDVIQGEIARLHHKFVVNLDSLHHVGSNVIKLQCKLNDKRLPSLPSLVVTLPENYPHSTPILEMIPKHYDSTPFLKKVKEILLDEMDHMMGQYSLTAFLNLWEISVRKAFNKIEAFNCAI